MNNFRDSEIVEFDRLILQIASLFAKNIFVEKIGSEINRIKITMEKAKFSKPIFRYALIVGISKRKIEENISKLKFKVILKRVSPDKGGALGSVEMKYNLVKMSVGK